MKSELRRQINISTSLKALPPHEQPEFPDRQEKNCYQWAIYQNSKKF